MKSFIKLFLLTFVFSISVKVSVKANATFEKANLRDGVIGIQYTGNFKNAIKVTVEKGSERYIYKVKNNQLNYVPLQLGAGTYKVSVYEQVQGTKYKSLAAENINLANDAPLKMYTYSTLETYFNSSMDAIKNYNKLVDNKKTTDKILSVYNDVIKNYSYDYSKASSVSSEYVPYIDDMYELKKGICYDYSALMAGALRSQGVPVKLVKGYAPEIKEYHAWNEIYYDGKWHVVDTTYDAAMVKAGKATKFSKDASLFKPLYHY